MLQGYVGNFFETGKLFVNRNRESKNKKTICPIGTQYLSDIFEVRPKRVNLKYQQKTLQYIFSKPSHFEHPFQQNLYDNGCQTYTPIHLLFSVTKTPSGHKCNSSMQFDSQLIPVPGLTGAWTSDRKPPTPSQDSLRFIFR